MKKNKKKDNTNIVTTNIIIVAALLVVGIITIVAYRGTYAAGTYNVIFHYARSSDGIIW